MSVTRLALAALACVVFSAPVAAQPVGTIGVYFDPNFTQSSIQIPGTVFTPASFYVVASGIEALGPTSRLKGYEFSLNVPPIFTVTARTMSPPTSIDVGAGNDNWVVGTGACITPTDGNVLLVTYTYLILAPPGDNLFLEFGAASPSTFDPPFPGWLDCEGVLYPFEQTVPGRVNPVACELTDATIDGTNVTGVDGQGGELFSVDVGKDVVGVHVNDFDNNGDNNILYWTASDGVEPGTVGQLDCQGAEVWSFTSSGLACQPTDGIVDVIDVQIGEFDGTNAGDEILVTALDNPANDVPVTRLDLLGLDGTLLGPSQNFEYWAMGRVTSFLIDTTTTPTLVMGGTGNATGRGLVLRVPLNNLRGVGPDPVGSCFVGATQAVARWNYVLGGNNGTIDPFFQAEDGITDLELNGAVLTVTGSSGEPYDVDRASLQPLACELASLSVVGDQVSGLDGSATELWSLDFTGSTVELAEVVIISSAPVAVIALGPGGPYPNAVLAYECHGKPAALVAQPGANCLGDAGAVLTAAELGPAGTSVERDVYATYEYASGRSRLSWLTLGTNVRTWAVGGDLEIPGAVQQSFFGDDGQGGTNLYLGIANADAGFAHVVAYAPASVGGSIEPLAELDCGPRQYLWSTLFDGLGFPMDAGDIVSMQVVLPKVDPYLEVVTTNATYLLRLTDGTLIEDSCSVDPVEIDFGTVPLNDSADRDFTITNTGAFQLTGTVTGCSVVEVVGDAAYDLAPGQDKVFTLRFTPPTAGVHECFLDTGDACAAVHTIGIGQDLSAVPTFTAGSASGLAAGDEVTISIGGTTLGGIAGFDGRLLYDGAAFEFVEATLGVLLESEGGFSAAFNGTTSGELAFAVASAEALPLAPGSGDVIDVTLRIAEDAMPGSYTLALANVRAFDEQADAVDVDTVDGSLDVLCRLFDVTGDGDVFSNDAIVTLRIDVGLVEGTPTQICAADVDGNGEVEANDAVAILQYVVGLPLLKSGASLGDAIVRADGPVRRLDDGAFEADVVVEANGALAGLDLDLRLEGGRLAGVALVGDEGLLVHRLDGGRASVAAAAARVLGEGGIARLTLRIEDADLGIPWTLRVDEGQAFGSQGERAQVRADAIELSLAAPTPSLQTQLFQNRPNPFNPRTEIRFALSETGPVMLRIYDVAGRVVRTLLTGERPAGEQTVTWDGLDEDGRAVSSGVYLYRLETQEGSSSKRMILVR